MSMRWRLLGSYLLIIIIALGTVEIVARYTTEQEVQVFFQYGWQVGLENLAKSLETYYAESGSWDGIQSNFSTGTGRGRGQQATGSKSSLADHLLVDSSRKVIYSPLPEEIGEEIPEETLATSIPLVVSGEVVGYLLSNNQLPKLPDQFETLLIERVNQASFLAAVISGSLAILLALIFAAVILRPVRRLTESVKNMTSGHLLQQIVIRGKGELATLGKAFNQMSQTLQKAEESRQAMTADIAHELRNPLAIQRAHIEALQDGIFPLDKNNLALIAEQNQQLTRLVEDLRTLALADAGELMLTIRSIDLSKFCKETLARFEPQATIKQVKLSVQCGKKSIYINADKERLQQIVDNIIQNAFRYVPEHGNIKLSLQCHDYDAVLNIFNDGPPFSEDSLDHLFERFYRGEKARDRASGGTGLGLSIARKLAEAQGGTLIAENCDAKGVVFTLTFPIDQSINPT